MAKKIKLEVTDDQLAAIVELADTISAMVGCGDNDKVWIKSVKLIDRMLKKNGYKRMYS